MDRQKELRQWFALAEQDLNFAKNGAATMRPIPVERIWNLCQQSVEKYFKGYLYLNQVEFPFTHDLSALLILCADIVPEFMKFEKQCRYLTKFSVMPRYPNELQLTEDDAKTAIRFAEEIKEFVVNIIHNWYDHCTNGRICLRRCYLYGFDRHHRLRKRLHTPTPWRDAWPRLDSDRDTQTFDVSVVCDDGGGSEKSYNLPASMYNGATSFGNASMVTGTSNQVRAVTPGNDVYTATLKNNPSFFVTANITALPVSPTITSAPAATFLAGTGGTFQPALFISFPGLLRTSQWRYVSPSLRGTKQSRQTLFVVRVNGL